MTILERFRDCSCIFRSLRTRCITLTPFSLFFKRDYSCNCKDFEKNGNHIAMHSMIHYPLPATRLDTSVCSGTKVLHELNGSFHFYRPEGNKRHLDLRCRETTFASHLSPQVPSPQCNLKRRVGPFLVVENLGDISEHNFGEGNRESNCRKTVQRKSLQIFQPAPKYHTKGCSRSCVDSPGARTLVFAASEPFSIHEFRASIARTPFCTILWRSPSIAAQRARH